MSGRPTVKNTRLPDFLIIGAQKSASTFVQTVLREHPDVYMPKDETRFFEDPEFGEGDSDALRALFRGCHERRLGIKRPDYLGRPEVPARIRRIIPDAQLVVVLRNPIDRLLSAYYFYVKLGFLPVADINVALARLLDGEAYGGPKARELLEYGNYATHLERYRALFPAHQMLVLLQEEIQATPNDAVRRLCSFLRLEHSSLGPLPELANAGVYSLSRLRLLTLRNRFLYAYDAGSGKLIEKRRYPHRWLPAAAITALDRYVLRGLLGNDKPELRGDIRARLESYYEQEIQRTSELIGVDLGKWQVSR
ncbi:sulfotransferase domain-containing protein [Sinimarinibacterium flocculans]|uniref:Sulfotransferase domain-containing protein n=1 Tax=Sinimarinibacterium flocculans TaxID=985250 RepID=A0A318EH70_9GAMM|nr:sulfotransferase domain-containing protein [Sinimarinibacterium flocculans]PXV67796.1 sulfotransferase domain-containing protein [Sinimarinibacterium flocculans]HBG29765.1 hypothetical protein [Gammaproteobacteria bacterium]